MLERVLLQSTGIESLRNVAGNVADYIPYVQGLCFGLAGVSAIVFTYVMYDDMVHERGQMQKKMLMCLGSVLVFIGLAIYTPSFFGLEKSITGSFVSDTKYGITGMSSDGVMTRQRSDGTISTGVLLSDIPKLDSPVWLEKYDLSNNEKMDNSEKTFMMFAELYSKWPDNNNMRIKQAHSMYNKGQISAVQRNTIILYSNRRSIQESEGRN